jgi:hypothetical protein
MRRKKRKLCKVDKGGEVNGKEKRNRGESRNNWSKRKM